MPKDDVVEQPTELNSVVEDAYRIPKKKVDGNHEKGEETESPERPECVFGDWASI